MVTGLEPSISAGLLSDLLELDMHVRQEIGMSAGLVFGSLYWHGHQTGPSLACGPLTFGKGLTRTGLELKAGKATLWASSMRLTGKSCKYGVFRMSSL